MIITITNPKIKNKKDLLKKLKETDSKHRKENYKAKYVYPPIQELEDWSTAGCLNRKDLIKQDRKRLKESLEFISEKATIQFREEDKI